MSRRDPGEPSGWQPVGILALMLHSLVDGKHPDPANAFLLHLFLPWLSVCPTFS